MSSVNKMILIGHLGADPELKYIPSGKAVCTFRIATSETWKDDSGNKQERTEWTTVVAWAQLGEVCAKYLTKGRPVYVEGRKQTRTYDDKDGVKRYFTECVAQEVKFLGDGKGGGEGGGEGRGRSDSKPSSDSKRGDDRPPPGGFGHDADGDIPF